MAKYPHTRLQAFAVVAGNTVVSSGGAITGLSSLHSTGGTAVAALSSDQSRGIYTAMVPISSAPWSANAGIVASSTIVDVSSSSKATEVVSADVLLESTFSDVPVFWKRELEDQYRELGQALTELSELEVGDEWSIDLPVYQAACHVALLLMEGSFPPPAVFSHGPKSIVFNWVSEASNLYLTVSADHMSALISTPEKIKRRVEIPKALLAQQAFLPTMKSLKSDVPVFSRVTQKST